MSNVSVVRVRKWDRYRWSIGFDVHTVGCAWAAMRYDQRTQEVWIIGTGCCRRARDAKRSARRACLRDTAIRISPPPATLTYVPPPARTHRAGTRGRR